MTDSRNGWATARPHFPNACEGCSAATIFETSVPTFVDDSLPLPIGPGIPLTPSAFLEARAARLDRLHGADAAPMLLRAIPIKTSST
jgi:hypothetical protein